jgi:hypothetical protein
MRIRWRDAGGETSGRRNKRARAAHAAPVWLSRSAALAHPEDVVVEAVVRLLAGVGIAASLVVLDLVQAPDRSAQVRAERPIRARSAIFVHRVFPSFVHK